MTHQNTFEEWRPIPGFEGFYEASNIGNIRSVKRTITKCNGAVSTYQSKQLSKKTQLGYERVVLVKVGEKFDQPVHRLIALAFLKPVKGKKYINHKNGIKNDNRVENLEWCTVSENTKHAYKMGLLVHPRPMLGVTGALNSMSKKIIAYSPSNEMKIFYGLSEASKCTGIAVSNIHNVITGKRESVKEWRFNYEK